jgi:hypothetical protein
VLLGVVAAVLCTQIETMKRKQEGERRISSAGNERVVVIAVGDARDMNIYMRMKTLK